MEVPVSVAIDALAEGVLFEVHTLASRLTPQAIVLFVNSNKNLEQYKPNFTNDRITAEFILQTQALPLYDSLKMPLRLCYQYLKSWLKMFKSSR